MKPTVDIENSSGYFRIKMNNEVITINVKDMNGNSPILLSVINNKVRVNDIIEIPKTNTKFQLLEKNMKLILRYPQKEVSKESSNKNHISLLNKEAESRYNINKESNNVVERNKIISKGINYIYTYNPEEHKTYETISYDIFYSFKKCKMYSGYIHKRFLNRLKTNVLEHMTKKYGNFVICCVPSHNECGEIKNVISQIVKNIDEYNEYFVNGCNVLFRKYEIEKATFDKNNRDFFVQYKSLDIRKVDIIKGKTILLIDDIYTTGATMNACEQKLIENGAKEVIKFAFAKTREKEYYGK